MYCSKSKIIILIAIYRYHFSKIWGNRTVAIHTKWLSCLSRTSYW